MDDLLGEDWQSSPKLPSMQPISTASYTSNPNSLQPTPQSSGSARSTPLNLSRPSSTAPGNVSKSLKDQSTSTPDIFGNLTGLKSVKASNGTGLSIQEKQRQLAEERHRQLQEQGRLWDSLGGASKSNGTTASRIEDDEDDILAAFNKDAKVDKSSHFPPPSLPSSVPASGRGTPANGLQHSSSDSFDVDDDTFGLIGLAKSNGHVLPSKQSAAADDDDILGDLSRPVAVRPVQQMSRVSSGESGAGWDETVAQKHSETQAAPQNGPLAELVEMGFPEETASIALVENGGDVQRSVGWLLQQAHEESKQKIQEQRSGRRSPLRTGTSPPRRARGDEAVPSWMKQEARSGSGSRQRETQDKDATQIAQDFGSKLFKSANSLWKASQKQMAKTVAEFQQERDPSQPKWMQSTDSGPSSREHSRPRPEQGTRVVPAQTSQLTNEAALLDMPREGLPTRGTRSSVAIQTEQMPRRDQSPALSQVHIQPKAQPQPMLQDKRSASKLSRQEVEEQSAQAYVSPARRKQTKSRSEPQPEPEVDLFSPAPVQPVTMTAKALVENSVTRPTVSTQLQIPGRSIPNVSSTALSTSERHRKLGTEAFKRGDYGAALEAYSAALTPLPPTHPLVIVILSNRSLTALKTGDAKTAVSDADRALDIIGPGLGTGEKIDISPTDGQKDMREFYGKVLMRKAEALEHMEKWTLAADAWRVAVEAGAGGAVSIRSRDRCEKAANPGAKSATSAPRASKPPPARTLANSAARSALTTPVIDDAVKKLREANAAAERADDEKFQLADKVDAKLVAWKGGKADNLRALLQSLDGVLWETAGWNKVGMSDLVMPNKVKIIYMKAIAKVHPDKIAQDASTEQRMISASVFSTLNEAWDKFKKDNNL